MPPAPSSRPTAAKPYLIGFALALLLTLISFGLVASRALAPASTAASIAVAAAAQIIVHLRFFLHLDFKPKSQENLLALAFAAVVIFIMVGGSLWILFDLNGRMM
jgi:cytochrome o ubiquinol oxidase operon protein cyoD